jgi:hypothetical protein
MGTSDPGQIKETLTLGFLAMLHQQIFLPNQYHTLLKNFSAATS